MKNRWVVIKRFAIIIVIVAALLVGLLTIGIATLDKTQYTSTIVDAVEAASGRKITLDRDIRFEWSLVPRMSLGNIAISNPAWSAVRDFATIDSLTIQARLLPLMIGRIAIKKFRLTGVRINLETDKRGRSNWSSDGDDDQQSGGLTAFTDTVIDDLSIRDLTIAYRGADGSETEYRLNTLSLQSTAADRPVDLVIDASVFEQPLHIDAELDPLSVYLSNAPANINVSGKVGVVEFKAVGGVRAPLDMTGLDVRVSIGVQQGDAAPLSIPPDSELVFNIKGRDKGVDLDGLSFSAGGIRATGTATLDWGEDRPQLTAQLVSDQLNVPVADSESHTEQNDGERLLPTTRLPLEQLTSTDAKLAWQISSLHYGQLQLNGVKFDVDLTSGRLQAAFKSDPNATSSVTSTMQIDTDAETATVAQTVSAKGVPIGAVLKNLEQYKINGGSLNLHADIAGRGTSVAEILGSSNGLLALDMGPTSIDSQAMAAIQGDLLMSLSGILQAGEPADRTSISCAAIRFPIKHGLMQNENGLAMQTDKINLLGGGTINLKDEKIDIGINAKSRKGTGLSISNFADFVRVGGSLKNPRPTTNMEGAAAAGLKVGAAVATVGLSVIAEGIFDRATADSNVCELVSNPNYARAGARESTRSTTKSKVGSAIESAGDKVRGVFGKLFGKD